MHKICFTISLFHASTCFEHMCPKHVEAWNKLIVKQKCCASSWLITETNIWNKWLYGREPLIQRPWVLTQKNFIVRKNLRSSGIKSFNSVDLHYKCPYVLTPSLHVCCNLFVLLPFEQLSVYLKTTYISLCLSFTDHDIKLSKFNESYY